MRLDPAHTDMGDGHLPPAAPTEGGVGVRPSPALSPPAPGRVGDTGQGPRVLTADPSPVAGGLAAFRAFLQSEYSEENIDFWVSCEEYKRLTSPAELSPRARKIYEEFISVQATKEVGPRAQTWVAVRFPGLAGHWVEGKTAQGSLIVTPTP